MPVQYFVHFDLASREALGPEKPRCVAEIVTKKRQDRCGNKISDAKFTALKRLYGQHTADPRSDLPLPEFAKLCLCTQAEHDSEPYISYAVQQWTRNISDPTHPCESIPEVTKAVSKRRGKKKGAQTDFCLPPIMFEPYILRDAPDRVDEKILALLNKKLKSGSKRKTFVYIFTHEAAGNTFKVGCTKSIKRFEGHKGCYPGHEIVHFTSCRDAERAEKLVHAEWDQYRRKHGCENYSKHKNKNGRSSTHREWFECTRDDIRDSVNGWAKFVDNAYLEDGYINYKYTPRVARGITNERRWQKWIHEVLEQNRIPSNPASRTSSSGSIKSSNSASSNGSVSTGYTSNTSRPENPEAPSTPIPIHPSPGLSVEEPADNVLNIPGKSLPSKSGNSEPADNLSLFGIAKGIFNNLLLSN
ncbi:hypothetical protein BDV29DRAFT_168440 [Aspergillus leporis]|uniref:Bacteriophage T5 Orf172 DNA-binding domain-containing protein n=1 Tax=Aspergillus leporis TaxID=41062 RepID=A0A5N5XDS8_9EURO|nr:hypothetical protein BDV29DRAFT_168440 [Aspergillus leporis]